MLGRAVERLRRPQARRLQQAAETRQQRPRRKQKKRVSAASTLTQKLVFAVLGRLTAYVIVAEKEESDEDMGFGLFD